MIIGLCRLIFFFFSFFLKFLCLKSSKKDAAISMRGRRSRSVVRPCNQPLSASPPIILRLISQNLLKKNRNKRKNKSVHAKKKQAINKERQLWYYTPQMIRRCTYYRSLKNNSPAVISNPAGFGFSEKCILAENVCFPSV